MAASPSGLLGLQRVNLRDQALTALRRAITSGELRPSSPLVETELSDQLGISRGTLREALRQLQQEGLAVIGPRGRLFVRHLDAKEITDIFVVRAALESTAAMLLAARADRADSARTLDAALDLMARAGDGDLQSRIEADLDFHRTMGVLTGNVALLHSWTTLEGSIRMSIMWAGVDRAVGNMDADRHRVIVEAIAAGDADRARREVLDHLAWAAQNLSAVGTE